MVFCMSRDRLTVCMPRLEGVRCILGDFLSGLIFDRLNGFVEAK